MLRDLRLSHFRCIATSPGFATAARPGSETWATHALFSLVVRHRHPWAVASILLCVSHPERFCGSGDLHFITASCYHARPYLATPEQRELFLNTLEAMRRRYCFAVLGYVVIPEHFHLLLSEPQRGTLSTVIQALKLGFH
jgi:hypothetical protein